LTGESEVVTKQIEALQEKVVPLGERTNLVFMGTGVASGTGLAVVVATGMKTELGRIAEMLEGAAGNEATPLQKRLASLGRVLIVAALGIVALMFGLGFLRGLPIFELTMTSVSLAVAAVPEGLPAVVTVALALGVRRMSRRHALVRKLAAVETLGSTSVICTDKTGTQTVGEMTVRALFVDGKSFSVTGEGYGPTGEVLIDGQKTGAVDSAPLLELGKVLCWSPVQKREQIERRSRVNTKGITKFHSTRIGSAVLWFDRCPMVGYAHLSMGPQTSC
jgi:Ca2+-transporting ATPase